MDVPIFPNGALLNDVEEWAESIETCVLMAKAGEALGTEREPMHTQTPTQKAANWILQGIVMQSLSGNRSLRQQIREQQHEEEQEHHGARALQMLMGCYREEQEEEQTEKWQALEMLCAAHLNPLSTPEQVMEYAEKIFELNRTLDEDDRLDPRQLAKRVRGLVPVQDVAHEWQEAQRELFRLGENHNPLAVVNAIQTTFVRCQTRSRLAGSRVRVPLGQTADERLTLALGRRGTGSGTPQPQPRLLAHQSTDESAAGDVASEPPTCVGFVAAQIEDWYGVDAGWVFDAGEELSEHAFNAMQRLLPKCDFCGRPGHKANPSAPGAKDGCYRRHRNEIDETRFAKVRPEMQKSIMADRALDARNLPISQPPPRAPRPVAGMAWATAGGAGGNEDVGACPCVAFGGAMHACPARLMHSEEDITTQKGGGSKEIDQLEEYVQQTPRQRREMELREDVILNTLNGGRGRGAGGRGGSRGSARAGRSLQLPNAVLTTTAHVRGRMRSDAKGEERRTAKRDLTDGVRRLPAAHTHWSSGVQEAGKWCAQLRSAGTLRVAEGGEQHGTQSACNDRFERPAYENSDSDEGSLGKHSNLHRAGLKLGPAPPLLTEKELEMRTGGVRASNHTTRPEPTCASHAEPVLSSVVPTPDVEVASMLCAIQSICERNYELSLKSGHAVQMLAAQSAIHMLQSGHSAVECELHAGCMRATTELASQAVPPPDREESLVPEGFWGGAKLRCRLRHWARHLHPHQMSQRSRMRGETLRDSRMRVQICLGWR